MQNINEDTEWNDILREKGIIPPKEKPKEEEPEPELTLEEKYDGLSIDALDAELDSFIDAKGNEKDEEFLMEYREKRMAEMKERALKAKFGTIRDVTKSDWKTEVNGAGDVFVVIHIYQKGNETSALTDNFLRELAAENPCVKFLRGEAVTCMGEAGAAYPTASLPTFLIYRKGEMKSQSIGKKDLGLTSQTQQITKKVIWERLCALGVFDDIKSSGKTRMSNGDRGQFEDGDSEDEGNAVKTNRIRIRTAPGKGKASAVTGFSSGRKSSDDDSDPNDW